MMRRMRALPFLALLSACASAPVKTDPSLLLRADEAFSADVQQRGIQAWIDAFAPNGAQLPTGAPLTVGHAAIRELMASAFSDPSFRLRWSPTRADVSGDLGYTIGTFESTRADCGTQGQ
jgi:hypothetical protein